MPSDPIFKTYYVQTAEQATAEFHIKLALEKRIAELEAEVDRVKKVRDRHYDARQELERISADKTCEIQGLHQRNGELKETLAKTEQALAAEAGKRATAEAELSTVMKRHCFAGDREVSLFNFAKQQSFLYVRSDIHGMVKAELYTTDCEYKRVAKEHGDLCVALNKASDDIAIGRDRLKVTQNELDAAVAHCNQKSAEIDRLKCELAEFKKQHFVGHCETPDCVTVEAAAGQTFVFTHPDSVTIAY